MEEYVRMEEYGWKTKDGRRSMEKGWKKKDGKRVGRRMFDEN